MTSRRAARRAQVVARGLRRMRFSRYVLCGLFAVAIALTVYFARTVGSPADASGVCTPTKSRSTFPIEYRFTTTGTCTWTIPSGVSAADVVVVGGGGGGGFGSIGGGGGAGQVMATSSPIAVTSGGSVSITVGLGGTGGWTTSEPTWRNGSAGGNSLFDGVTALGGGGGGGNVTTAGTSGGSGGGGAGVGSAAGGAASVVAAPAGWTKYGNNGGTGWSDGSGTRGGGGGGAGAAGVNGSVNTSSGNGGTGVTLFGYNLAGGGDGWQATTSTSNQDFGGGAGSSSVVKSGTGSINCPTCQGDANTGGGGGGGGDGGSGVVIVRFGSAPTVATQPANQTVGPNGQATFSVGVTQTYGGTLSYQWQKAESTSTTT